MLRKISTKTVISRANSQFLDSRATPTITPRTVAAMQPSTATISVFSRPTTDARRCESSAV